MAMLGDERGHSMSLSEGFGAKLRATMASDLTAILMQSWI
jgi:hypothetical protein